MKTSKQTAHQPEEVLSPTAIQKDFQHKGSRTNSQQRPDNKGHALALTVAKKHEKYHYEKPSRKGFFGAVKKKLRDQTECSSSSLKNLLFLRIPIIQWLSNYNLKRDLVGDLIAGVTVAVMHIPQGMAYASLVYMDPIAGIYMAFFPVIFYAIFASSRHCSMGSFAIICLMTGKVVAEFATIQEDSAAFGNGNTNLSVIPAAVEIASYSPEEVSTIICFGIAIWMFIFGFLNLGVLSVFLSDMLVSGFTTGAAVQVLTSQMQAMLGIKLPKNNGPFHAMFTWKNIFEKISESNPATMIITAICIAVLVIYNETLKPLLAKVTRIPVPIELSVVLGGTLAAKYGMLDSNYGVRVVGHIPTGFPSPTLPPFALLGKVFMPCLTIAVVSFSVSFSMAKILANKCNYVVDPTQELYATGIGNIVGSLFQCAPISASLSRSLIQEAVGGATQLASLISCCILALIVLYIGSFFESLPKCVLGAVIITALKGMFMQVFDFTKMWKISKVESLVWLITFLSVIVIDIDIGLFLGIIASLVFLLYKSQKPTITVLGRVPDSDIYLDMDRYRNTSAREISGIKILHIAGTFHFANKDSFRQGLAEVSGSDPKAIRKEESKQNKELEKKNNGKLTCQAQEKEFGNKISMVDDKVCSEINNLDLHLPHIEPNFEVDKDLENGVISKIPQEVGTIILDMSGVGQMDVPGAKNMADIYKDYAAGHVTLLYSSISDPCLEILESSGALKTIPAKAIFHSIHDAVFCVSFPELHTDN